MDDFNACSLGSFHELLIFGSGIKNNTARFRADDFINQRRRAFRTNIHGHRVNRTGDMLDARVTLFAEDFGNGRIYGDGLIAVLLKPLHRHEGITIWFCRGTENDNGFYLPQSTAQPACRYFFPQPNSGMCGRGEADDVPKATGTRGRLAVTDAQAQLPAAIRYVVPGSDDQNRSSKMRSFIFGEGDSVFVLL